MYLTRIRIDASKAGIRFPDEPIHEANEISQDEFEAHVAAGSSLERDEEAANEARDILFYSKLTRDDMVQEAVEEGEVAAERNTANADPQNPQLGRLKREQELMMAEWDTFIDEIEEEADIKQTPGLDAVIASIQNLRRLMNAVRAGEKDRRKTVEGLLGVPSSSSKLVKQRDNYGSSTLVAESIDPSILFRPDSKKEARQLNQTANEITKPGTSFEQFHERFVTGDVRKRIQTAKEEARAAKLPLVRALLEKQKVARIVHVAKSILNESLNSGRKAEKVEATLVKLKGLIPPSSLEHFNEQVADFAAVRKAPDGSGLQIGEVVFLIRNGEIASTGAPCVHELTLLQGYVIRGNSHQEVTVLAEDLLWARLAEKEVSERL